MTKDRTRSKFFSSILAVVAATGLLLFVVAPTASFAAKGSGGGGKHGGGGTSVDTGSFSLVVVTDVNGNGQLNALDSVTFKVTTTALLPYVQLFCYQNGVQVSQSTIGFYSGYLFPQNFTLRWSGGGAADCTANLVSGNMSGAIVATLATMSFHVNA